MYGLLTILLLCLCCTGLAAKKTGHFPHDIKTKSGLTQLYNKEVVKVEHLKRPMLSSSSGVLSKLGAMLGVNHEGVRVTTRSGDQWLVHKGPGYGKSSDTVVTDAKHMSGAWKVTGSKAVTGHTVSDFVKAGGSKYKLFRDNCKHAAKRMRKLGHK